MIKINIGSGDFAGMLSREGIGSLLVTRSLDCYGSHENPFEFLSYKLFLDSAIIQHNGQKIPVREKTLVRIKPGVNYSIEINPERHAKGLVIDGKVVKQAYEEPVKVVTFQPEIILPAEKYFEPIKVYNPGGRSTDWFCGEWTEKEELGVVPIEIAHGYVNYDYINDQKRNIRHYHKEMLEGWLPLYGKLVVKVWEITNGRVREETGKEVEISPLEVTALEPTEAHQHARVIGAVYWETITFKFPGGKGQVKA